VRWQLAEAKRSEDWSAAATPLSVRPVASKSGVAPALRDSRHSPKLLAPSSESFLHLFAFRAGTGGLHPAEN